MAVTEPWILAVDLGHRRSRRPARSPSTVSSWPSRDLARCRRRTTDDGGAVQDPADLVGRHPRGCRRGAGLGRVDPTRADRGRHHRPVGLDGPGRRRTASRSGAACCGPTPAAAASRRGRMGGPIALFGYSPGNLLRWIQAHRWCAVTARRRPPGPRALPARPRARRLRDDRDPARAARLPRDALHRPARRPRRHR